MPWFPELFSASVLDRIRRDAADARASEPVPYFDGVRSGEIEALVGSSPASQSSIIPCVAASGDVVPSSGLCPRSMPG